MPANGKKIDRRRYLSVLGASSAAIALTGCSDDSSAGSNGSSGNDGSNPKAGNSSGSGNSSGTSSGNSQQARDCKIADKSFTEALPDDDPTKYQFNPFNSKLLFGDGIHYDLLGNYKRASQEYENLLAKDWSLDKDALTLTLRDQTWLKRSGDLRDGEWSKLEPVTAEDVSLQLWMWKFQETPIIDLFDDWEVKDDKTIEIRRASTDYSDTIFKQRAIPNSIVTPRSIWKGPVEKLKGMDAESDEFSTVLGEKILNRKIGPGEIVANGPWLFDSVEAKRRVIATKNPEHPKSGNINFDTRDWVKVGKGKQGMVTGMNENNIDFAGDQRLTKSVRQGIPDGWQLAKSPALGGGALYYNMDHEWWGNRFVRQATMFAVDNAEVTGNVNSEPINPHVTGISNKTVRNNWLGSDFMGKMTDYGGKQREKAAEMMRKAGAEKNGNGWWADSSGNPIEGSIKTLGGWTAAVTMAQTIASQFQDFGLKVKAVGIENSEFLENHWNPDEPSKVKDFTMLRYPVFGAFGIYHPYYYEYFFYGGDVAKNQIKTAREYEVPSKIGDPESSTETIDPVSLTEEMAASNDEKRVKEISRQLSWLFNQNVVAYQQDTGTNSTWYDTAAWKIPSVSDPANPPDEYIDYGLNGMFTNGVIQAKCQDQ